MKKLMKKECSRSGGRPEPVASDLARTGDVLGPMATLGLERKIDQAVASGGGQSGLDSVAVVVRLSNQAPRFCGFVEAEMKEKVCQWLSARSLPLVLGVLAAALLLPALFGGLQLDDHFQRFRLLGLDDRGALSLFVFYNGDPEVMRGQMEAGYVPWWANLEMRHANFRYLSVLTMQLDYLLWPDNFVLMHAHSLAWLAALVVVATSLYRRVFALGGLGALGVPCAGLASLLYAVDDAHSLPAAYLANRNALIATTFGLAAVLAFARLRGDGWRPGLWLTPLLLALSLSAGEIGASTCAYLFGYVLFLDSGSIRSRLVALSPSATVAALWLAIHRLGGYGSEGSGFYVDPLGAPLDHAFLLIDRALALTIGQWTPVPSDWLSLLPLGTSGATGMRLAGLLLVTGLGLLFARLSRARSQCGFFAVGAVLSLAPVAAASPQDRLLFFVGFGSMGMIGALAVNVATEDASRVARASLGVLLIVHTVLAVPMAYVFLDLQNRAARQMERAAESVSSSSDPAGKRVLLVNPPDSVYSVTSIPMMRMNEGRAAPRSVRALAHGGSRMTVRTVDERTLRVVLERGLFPDAFSRYYRDPGLAFLIGDRVELSDLIMEIEELCDNGDPKIVRVTIPDGLWHADNMWFVHNGQTYEAWTPPSVGVEVTIEPVPSIFS